MIIDADTHIAPSEKSALTKRGVGSFSTGYLIDSLDKAGADMALTWLSPHHYQGIEISEHNKFVYDAAKKHPKRILPFGWTDPTLGVEHAKKMVKLCTEEYGFYGVKMNGAQNNYYIDDPEMAFPVAEEIAKSGKMIAFHIGPDAYERTHPSRAARIAKAFPETKILMVHMGQISRDMNRAVFEFAEECPNMVLIASATNDVSALLAIKRLGASRVCFGSDHPFQKISVVKAMFDASFQDELSEEDFKLFMGGNIERLFGLV